MVGIFVRPEESRVYPAGDLANALVGGVDPDEQGTFGVEKIYNDVMKGSPGKERFERGQFGSISVGSREVDPATAGNDVVLRGAPRPVRAPRATGGRPGGSQHRRHPRVVHRRPLLARVQPLGFGGGEVAPHRLDIKAEMLGDPFLRQPQQPQPEDLFDFDHRDLAVG